MYAQLRASNTKANACWRYFWHFTLYYLRDIAGQRLDYLSAEGLGYMQQLYQELQVPLDAMILGLTSIKIAILNRLQLNQQTVL